MLFLPQGADLQSRVEKRSAFFKVITLREMNVDQGLLLRDVLPSFELLSWDYYDVRREQVEIIIAGCPYLDAESKANLAKYYRGMLPLQMLTPLIDRLARSERERLRELQPYRRRHVNKVRCAKSDSGEWQIALCRTGAITQIVDDLDYRSIERIFPRIDETIWNHSEMQKLILAVITLVSELEPQARLLTMTCWQNGLVARPERAGNNSPEGIHQDGADYIVSALVLERRNVAGGTSRIFGPDKATLLFEHTLGQGEGILQSDAGSPLWHDVTPIELNDSGSGQIGIRNTIGFDINVDRS